MSSNNQFSETNIILAMISGITEERARMYSAWLHEQYPTGIPVCAIRDDFPRFTTKA